MDAHHDDLFDDKEVFYVWRGRRLAETALPAAAGTWE